MRQDFDPVQDPCTGRKTGDHDSIYLRLLLGMAGFLPAADLYEYTEQVHTVTGTEPVP